jgi:beta-phosphoglucomutase-like phosphatase (HAD superfamily)
MPLAAVIFDFDGVAINSHEALERSWFALAEDATICQSICMARRSDIPPG